MAIIKNIGLQIIFNLFLLLTAYCQQKEKDLVLPDINQYSIKVWTGEQGVPANGALCIMQSKDGYIYLGTYDGFVRFDGMTMKVFKKSDFKKMANSVVQKIAEDNDGNLYFATQAGLFILYKNGTEKLLTKQDGLSSSIVIDLMFDSQQRLWIGTTTGINYYYKNKIYPTDVNINDKNISDITFVEDTKKNIWISTTSSGVIKIKDNLVIEPFKEIDVKNINLNSIFCDSKGKIWISSTKGIYVVDQNNTTKLITKKDGLPDDNVMKVFEDEDGVIWIGLSKGLCYYYKGVFSKLLENKNIANYGVVDIMQDKEKNLWITTYRSGVFRMQTGSILCYTTKQGLSEKTPNAIIKLKNGNLLIALQNTLNIWDGKQISDLHIQGVEKFGYIRDVFEDSKQNIWVSTITGLEQINDNKLVKTYTVKDGLTNNYSRYVLEDQDHSIWVGTSSGLNKFSNGKWKTFTLNDGMSNDFILSLYNDKANNIWVGTKDGLNKIRNDSIQSFSVEDGLVSNIIFQMHQDITGALWITNNGGLTKYLDGKFHPVKTSFGSFFQIKEDPQGYFWMSSTDGIYRIHRNELNQYIQDSTVQLTFKCFNHLDGLLEKTCPANARAATANDGKIWICSLDGIAVVDPLNLKKNNILPVVKIEQIEIGGKIVPLTNEIIMPAGNHRLRIIYTAINFTAPERVKFKYQLIGLDEGFVDIGAQREVYYPEFPTGDYTFNIIACNNDDVWNFEGCSIKIRHLPYFYQTVWFYLIILIITFLSGIFIHRFRIYNLKKRAEQLEQTVMERTAEIIQQKEEIETQRDDIIEKNEELNKKKEEIEMQAENLIIANEKLRELNDFKEGMTSMIVHDLKNSLSIIINTPDRYSNEEKLEIKTRYGKQMLNMVMNILDVNKYEESRMVLDLQNFQLYEISNNAITQVQFLANDKNLRIKNNIDKIIGAKADAEIIERVFVNLLTNAIKYSHVNTTIFIDSEISQTYKKSQTYDFIKVKITNTGIAIPDEKHEVVFSKFGQIQSRSSGGVRSTGIGLTFCKMAVEAHGGTIDFISEPDKDTTFWFTLKKGNAFEIKLTTGLPVSETNNGIDLSDVEKIYLAQFLLELRKYEIYEITSLTEIIDKIEVKTEKIKLWKIELMDSINKFDEKEFQRIING